MSIIYLDTQKTKTIHVSSIALIMASSALLFLMGCSPFKNYEQYDHRLIKVSEDIDAKPAEVFSYLGNSDNAEDWSTFVDHIIPLNPDEKADGEQGAIRRCFVNQDESGETWDEEILLVEENKYRKLSCYNFQNFIISADNLRTEQLYETMENGNTQLSFTLFFEPEKASLMDKLKMHIAARRISSIFEDNLRNIKYFVEDEYTNAQ